MVQWRDNDCAMKRYRWRDRASSSSCHRTIALSYYRVFVIAPSTQTRWCDGTIVNYVALSGFHISDINLKCIVSSLVTSFVGICLKIIWYELLNAAIWKSNQSTVSTAKRLASLFWYLIASTIDTLHTLHNTIHSYRIACMWNLKYKYECSCTSMYKQMLILNQKLIAFVSCWL